MSRNERALPAGTYRILDGRLYRVEPGLPPSLDTRDAEIATLRTRAEQAEAERDEARALKVPPSVDELNAALMKAAVARVERDVATARAEAAEAEVARLRKEQAAWDRQSLADYRKLREQFDAAVERAEQAEAERDEAVENARLTGIRLAGAEAVIRDLRGEGPEHHEYADALVIVAMTLAARDGEGATTMTIRRAAGALRTADKRVAQAEAEVARLRGTVELETSKIAQARASALREAADVARAHGGISAYYAIVKLAAEVEPAEEGEL